MRKYAPISMRQECLVIARFADSMYKECLVIARFSDYCSRMRRLSAVLLGALLAACASQQAPNPPAQVAPPINTAETEIAPDAMADSLLTDVRSLEPRIVVELRYATSNNFTGAPLAGYFANRAFLRREAAAALARVERDLRPQGVGLKIFDAYRPVRATLAMVDWTERVNRTDLLKDGYIASRSRHNLGLAIDLTLIDLTTDREFEMGTPFDSFSAAAHTANASGEAATNRQRLKAAMEREGFVNYDQEWWHFSYDVPNPLRFDRPIR
ncbi:MAG TPA: M15 family metallopeptidase [Gemmatimonadaceae bacterium]|jgi:D-alanyl-D-alanine dipeptidase|nr:M15 family metallopeptidase [Gemmatimonadaceae bacterium]